MVERALASAVVHRDRRRKSERAEEQPPEHGLLTLQRAAGNRAVARLLHRQPQAAKTGRLVLSKVAMAPGEMLYTGKCDADLSAPTVDVEWSRGLLGKDREVSLECGPQSFRFTSFRPWFDDEGFPWDIETTDGGSAWVTEPIKGALNDIYDDHEDAGSKFWSGYHKLKEALKSDLDAFCDK